MITLRYHTLQFALCDRAKIFDASAHTQKAFVVEKEEKELGRVLLA